MKRTILAALFLHSDLGSFLYAQENSKKLEIPPEDEDFWMRFLKTGDGSLPVPTNPPPVPKPPSPPPPVPNPPSPPPPTPSPLSPPIAAPTSSPVTPPVVAPTPIITNAPIKPPTSAPIPEQPEVCNVDVSISCVTDSGSSCDELQPPNPVCSDGTEVNSVIFGYSGNSCNPAGNNQGTETFCEDFSPILFLDAVTVLCRDAAATETALIVEPPEVEPGATFSVMSPSGAQLPDKIDCVFTDVDDIILQQVVIDTSGDVPLNLRDEFGAFTLLSCELPSSPEGGQNCLEVLTYTVDVTNTGTVEMQITKVDFVFEGTTTNLLNIIGDISVPPGGTTSVIPIVLIDLCTGEDFCAEVNVEAEPPNGNMCQDTTQYCVNSSPLAPSPVESPITPPVAPPVISTAAPVPQPVSKGSTAPVLAPTPVESPVTPPVAPPVATTTAPVPQPVNTGTNAPVLPPVVQTAYPISPPVIPTAPVAAPKSKGTGSMSSSGMSRF